MYIETRILGAKSRALDDWSIPTPPPNASLDGDSITLRDLISRVVRAEAQEFAKRHRSRRLLRVVSESEVRQRAAAGRIVSGGQVQSAPVNEEQAVGAALQGFEDGLYLVVLDGKKHDDLDQQVFVNDDSRMVFLRLTFLAGA
jgi:hypothetical protein